jgi:hypothetical protein
MNKVLFRKLEKLKEEVLYLKTNRAKLLKSGLSDNELPRSKLRGITIEKSLSSFRT